MIGEQSSSEDQEETLKCKIKAQNQKKKILEEFLAQQMQVSQWIKQHCDTALERETGRSHIKC